MNRYIIPIAILAALGLTVWGGFGLNKHLIVAIDRYGDEALRAQYATDKFNGRYGTLSMLDEDLGTMKSVLVHADIAARHEDQQLSTFDGYAASIQADIHGAIGHANGTLDAATEMAHSAAGTIGELNSSIKTAQPLITDSGAMIKASTATIQQFGAVTTDEHIKSLIVHMDSIAGHVDGISADSQYRLHQLLRPDKKKVTFWGGTEAAVEWLHHLEPPLF